MGITFVDVAAVVVGLDAASGVVGVGVKGVEVGADLFDRGKVLRRWEGGGGPHSSGSKSGRCGDGRGLFGRLVAYLDHRRARLERLALERDGFIWEGRSGHLFFCFLS